MTMTRSDRDQRFEVTDVSRRGAHRARPNPLIGMLPAVALVTILVIVVGMAYVLFGRTGATSTSDTGSVPQVDASLASGAAGAASPAAGSDPSAQASTAASPQPQATVDKTLTLNMYNATSPNIPGLSRKAAAALEADGWKIGTIQTWTGPHVERTTIYYADPSQLATARAVARALGGGTARLNTNHTKTGLAVLVGTGYTP